VSTAFCIRPFRIEDEAAVLELWTLCGLIVPHNDPRKDIRRKLQVNPEWFLVGEERGKLLATCMAGYEGHRGWINYLAVAPTRQRQHLATRMMEKAEQILREAGCPKINLQVRSSNLQVIAFYESLGFKIDTVTSLGKRLEVDSPAEDSQAPSGLAGSL
jgi:ribosomal protein S18 acetylase RimI-like enzyme